MLVSRRVRSRLTVDLDIPSVFRGRGNALQFRNLGKDTDMVDIPNVMLFAHGNIAHVSLHPLLRKVSIDCDDDTAAILRRHQQKPLHLRGLDHRNAVHVVEFLF